MSNEAFFKSCFDKKSYESLLEAEHTIDEIQKREKVSLRIYKCTYCENWHLTSQVKHKSKKRRKKKRGK